MVCDKTIFESMNVLGVMFDCKLNWDLHVALAISKARKSVYALRLLKKFFNPTEMRILLDSYVYSTLYYNAVIWLTPSLSAQSKQNLLSISANALRSCMMFNSNEISFEDVHKSCKKSTPKQIMNYQMSLKLHKILNEKSFECSLEYVRVVDQIVCPRRQILFRIFKTNNYRIGMNTTANKLFYLNDQITLDSISYDFVHFKKIMKVQFLKYGKT